MTELMKDICNEHSKSIGNSHMRIQKLKMLLEKTISCQADILTRIKELDSRLVYIEEEVSSRARADHQRELALDFRNAEGLGSE